jgi:hypothetical protein
MNAPAPEPPRQRLAREVNREVARIRDEDIPAQRTERRCRVCQDPESQRKVNRLLAYGMGDTEILEHVADINTHRPKNAQITYWVIRRHRERHFNIQEPAQAAWRRILERRYAEQTDELAEGARHVLTALGYLDIVAHKGFEKLMHPDTEVGYTVGLEAMLKLEELQSRGEVERQLAEYRKKVGLLQQVVMEEVDEVTRARISRRLTELTTGVTDDDDDDAPIDAEVVDDDDDDEYNDDGWDPVMEADPEDTMGER